LGWTRGSGGAEGSRRRSLREGAANIELRLRFRIVGILLGDFLNARRDQLDGFAQIQANVGAAGVMEFGFGERHENGERQDVEAYREETCPEGSRRRRRVLSEFAPAAKNIGIVMV